LPLFFFIYILIFPDKTKKIYLSVSGREILVYASKNASFITSEHYFKVYSENNLLKGVNYFNKGLYAFSRI